MGNRLRSSKVDLNGKPRLHITDVPEAGNEFSVLQLLPLIHVQLCRSDTQCDYMCLYASDGEGSSEIVATFTPRPKASQGELRRAPSEHTVTVATESLADAGLRCMRYRDRVDSGAISNLCVCVVDCVCS